jgi:hypothetical protein
MSEASSSVRRNPISPTLPLEAGSTPSAVEEQGGSEENQMDFDDGIAQVPVASELGESEARRPVSRRAPVAPTAKEIAEHDLVHLPFRSWCPCCVAGKAKHWPHFKKSQEEKGEDRVPSIHMDYWFMRDNEDDERVTVLNYKEKLSRAYGAHIVQKKGVDAEIAKRVIKNLESWGCQGLVSMKTDQESAIRSLVEEVKRQRTSETLVELAKRYDSQSNGIAERSVQSIEGQVRTLKLALEQHLNGKISMSHVIMAWMVEHAADLLNKFAVGEDGRTAYERIKGKKYSGEALEFGREILYRIPCKPEGGNMSERWVPGVWLGKRSVSDEHVVGLEDGSVCVSLLLLGCSGILRAGTSSS